MNVKNSIPQGRIWWLKLPVAPDNGDLHFSKLFNVDEIKGIIHSRIYPAGDVVQSVWHNKSAMIRYNCIIKNYVIRKITSYIYLLIFTKSLWLHVKHFIALTKRESVRRIFFLQLPDQNYPLSTHRPVTDHEKHEKVRQHWRQKKTCVHIKRVKSDSYLTYGQSCKTYGIIPPSPPPQ